MTLRSAGFVTEPITGPRAFGSAAPQRIGLFAMPPLGSGWEGRRIWVERFGVLMSELYAEKDKAPRSGRPESLSVMARICVEKAAQLMTDGSHWLPKPGR